MKKILTLPQDAPALKIRKAADFNLLMTILSQSSKSSMDSAYEDFIDTFIIPDVKLLYDELSKIKPIYILNGKPHFGSAKLNSKKYKNS